MNGFVEPGGIVNDVIEKGNAALRDAIVKLELVEHFELTYRVALRFRARAERRDAGVLSRIADRRGARRRLRGRLCRALKREDPGCRNARNDDGQRQAEMCSEFHVAFLLLRLGPV